MHDPMAMNFIIELMGENKICLGSDYPFPLGEHQPGKLIENMGFTNELKEKLLFKNTNDWLNITA